MRRVTARFTDRSHGDLAVDAIGVEHRRRAIVDAPWTWLRQVHGSDVVVVTRPAEHAGVAADAAVTTVAGAVLAVQTADCAPVALAAANGVIGVVHAGWRGLAAGVVERAVAAMRELGAVDIGAMIGPCIHADCYEFGAKDLDTVAAAVGEHVRAVTRSGSPALDLPAGVVAALQGCGVAEIDTVDICTACSPDHWSHRADGATERQAVVTWLA